LLNASFTLYSEVPAFRYLRKEQKEMKLVHLYEIAIGELFTIPGFPEERFSPVRAPLCRQVEVVLMESKTPECKGSKTWMMANDLVFRVD